MEIIKLKFRQLYKAKDALRWDKGDKVRIYGKNHPHYGEDGEILCEFRSQRYPGYGVLLADGRSVFCEDHEVARIARKK